MRPSFGAECSCGGATTISATSWRRGREERSLWEPLCSATSRVVQVVDQEEGAVTKRKYEIAKVDVSGLEGARGNRIRSLLDSFIMLSVCSWLC